MAWKFVNAHDAAAVQQRQATVDRIDQWWEAFRNRTRDLDDVFHRRKQWDLPAWMDEHLGAIEPHLFWEFGAAPEAQGHYLVITPEQDRFLRPLVETILERAPQLPGWVLHGYRQPETVEVALQTVEARAGAPLAAATVQAQIGDWNRINLVYLSPDFAGPDDETARHQAFVATESLLGEEAMDKWCRCRRSGPPCRGRPDSSSFSRSGERFCFVKIDGSQNLEQMTFADREEMEIALDRVLKPARVGCVVGGGTELRYSYIDLALTDLDAAAGLVREALRAGRIPRRSWLLFNDCEWEDEWVGVWDDTPPPCLLPR
jgi:hypothetical protein